MNTESKIAIVVCGILAPLFCEASTLEFEFQSAVNNSFDVALVQIVRGQALGEITDECGGSYYAKVLKQYKGKQAKYLKFGSQVALKIGEKYFVLIDSKDSYVKNRSDWLDFRMRVYEEPHRTRVMKQWEKCQNVLPGKMISIELGAFAVDNPSELGYRTEAAKVPSLSVRLPKGTTCYEATSVDEFDKGLYAVWVKLPEMERITLEGMQSGVPLGVRKFIEPRECRSTRP